MGVRTWVLAVVVVACAVVRVPLARAQAGTTTIQYQSGSGSTGFASASFTAEYKLLACDGKLRIITRFIPGSLRFSDTYWVDGVAYPVSGFSPIVNDQGTFNGRVQRRDGGIIGSFSTTAGTYGGADCYGGITTTVADLGGWVDPGDSTAVQQFLASLVVVADTNGVYRDSTIESGIRQRLAKEKREAEARARQEAEEKAAAEKKAVEEKKAAEEKKSADGKTGADQAGGSSSGGTDSTGATGGDGQGTTPSGDSSSKSSSNTKTYVGAAGAAAGGIAGCASECGGGDDGDDAPSAPGEPRGPSTLTPVLGTLGGLVVGGLGLVGFLSWDERLADRLDQLNGQLTAACWQGDSMACARSDSLDEQLQRGRGGHDWSLEHLLLGPTAAYGLAIGYMREHHAGRASHDYPVALDGDLSGFAVEAAIRIGMLRFQADYHHLRGNLLGSAADYGSGYRLSETQGIDGMGMGIAAQLGYHHLIAPYAGFKFRLDSMSGHFDAGSNEHQLDGLEGGRSLASLGATINVPTRRGRVMTQGLTFTIELYRSLTADADQSLDAGLFVSAGYGAWIPRWVGQVEGLTGMTPDEGSVTSRRNVVMPYLFTSPAGAGGAGLQLWVEERSHFAYALLDLWLAPHGTSGLALFNPGVVVPLTPGGAHALGLRFGILAIQGERFVEDGMELSRLGIGTVTAYYRAGLGNQTLELAIKASPVWVALRSQEGSDDDADWFAGRPPMTFAVGLGY